MDKYIEEQGKELDPEKRKEINTKMLEAFKEDPPMIPLYFNTEFAAYKKGLNTPRISTFLFVRFWEFSWE